MIEIIGGAVPPATLCPFWCDQGFRSWEYVHGEWQRAHLSHLKNGGP